MIWYNNHIFNFLKLFRWRVIIMKKIMSVILVLMITAMIFAGCAGSDDKGATPAPTQANTDSETNSSNITKVGLGTLTSIASSKDKTDESGPVGQVDTVMAAVGFDSAGKVVSVTIDNAQTRVNFDTDLKLTSDPDAEYKTKVELGDEYGMKKRSEIGKEWYEQIAELEKWMVGKTVDEIKSMKTVNKDASHPAVPDEQDLTSLVTITVQDYIAVVEEAWNNAVDVAGNATKVGLGQNIAIGKSKGGEGENGPVAQVDTVMAAVGFTADGKIAAAVIDNAQARVSFDKDGKLTSDPNAEYKTKVELGDDYGMKKQSQIGKEWYEQIAELQKWMTGKTIDEVKSMKTVEKDASHPAVPDEPELSSQVTISVQDYIAAVAEAFDKAK
jgi:hypothetical protein